MKRRPSVARVRALLSYNPDTGEITWRVNRGRIKTGCRAGTIVTDGHRQVWFDGRRFQASHLIWAIQTGKWPPANRLVDHRDLNPANDRWDNLRLASPSQNQWNKRTHSWQSTKRKGVRTVQTTFKGVFTENQRFWGVISCRGVVYRTANHSTALRAFWELRRLRLKLHGQFARNY